MPELPEVETIARDLAPLLVGATITDAWWDWPKAHPPPRARGVPRRAIVGSRVLGVGRRAKWLVVDLRAVTHPGHPGEDDRAALRAAGRTPHDRHVHVRLDARRRPGRRRRLAPTGRAGCSIATSASSGASGSTASRSRRPILGAGRRGRAVRATSGPSRSTRPSRCARFRQRLRKRRGPPQDDRSPTRRFLAGVGNIYADEALWRARLHPLRSVAVAAAARRARALRRHPGGAARGHRAARAPRSTTTPRPRATARCRSTSTSTSAPGCPARAAADRSGGSCSGSAARTSARGASACPAADRTGTQRAARGVGARRRSRRRRGAALERARRARAGGLSAPDAAAAIPAAAIRGH